jgi:glycosyltransferase involved in cell wall biosynthesis
MSTKKILFYNDSTIFGGHEIMTARIINFLSEHSNYSLHCMFHHDYFEKFLGSKVTKIKTPFKTKTPLPGIRNFNFMQIGRIARLMKDIKPSLCVISQGDIEFCLKGFLAASFAGIKTVSYVPHAYSFSMTKNRLHIMRDLINKVYYQLPDAYITLDNHQKKLLTRLIVKKKPIYTITNLIEPVVGLERNNWKRQGGNEAINIGVIGRIYFRQKKQNILISIAQTLRRQMSNFKFYIIGEGPDRKKLEKLISRAGLQEYFVLKGWLGRNEMYDFTSKNIDLILIPSFFEGVPLVFLEALALKVPFLISTLDSLKEYDLLSPFLINQYDIEDIKNKIIKVVHRDNHQEYDLARESILQKHSDNAFKKDVMDVFSDLINR